ncbi:MAG: class I SAM-dependent methyltransferase [Candidatus Eiseniibacteriota bacterium]
MAEAHTFAGSIPEHYDRHLGSVLFQPFAADLAARIRPEAVQSALEIACGTGILTQALRARLKASASIVATDLNEPMMTYACAKLGNPAGITWRQADAAALPFPAASFDAVLCQFGIMFVPDKAAAAAEARRVLRPGGVFAFNVWGRIEDNDLALVTHETVAGLFPGNPPSFYTVPFSYHDPAEIRALLRGAGFIDVYVETVGASARISSAHDVATGLILGNPIVSEIVERGGDPAKAVEAVAAALTKRLGGDPPKARMRAIAVMAS